MKKTLNKTKIADFATYIGGFYGHTYLKCAVILLLMCVGFAIFGLLVYYPAKPINKLIAESKEKSGIM